jgi:hypothetical protein
MKKNLKTITVAGFNLAANALAMMAASSSSQAAVATPSTLSNPQNPTNTQANS